MEGTKNTVKAETDSDAKKTLQNIQVSDKSEADASIKKRDAGVSLLKF